MRARASALIPVERVIVPALDDGFALTARGARSTEPSARPRLEPGRVGHLDSHNELSKLILDIGDTVNRAADERAKAVVIRRLRRALEKTSA